MLSAIEAYVVRERERRGVKDLDDAIKPEPSGEGFGEFAMLLERQLMITTIGYGAWKELNDVAILTGVYGLVEQRSQLRRDA